MRKYLKLFKRLTFLFMMFLSFSSITIVSGVVDVDNRSSGHIASGSEAIDVEDVIGEDAMEQRSHVGLTTEVPEEINIVIVGQGSISNAGKTYRSGSSIRTTNRTFILKADKGYEIGTVYWNSVDITSMLINGVLTLSDTGGGVLKVTFVKASHSDDEHGELDPSHAEGEGSEGIPVEDVDDEGKENKKDMQESSSQNDKSKKPAFTKTADKSEMVFGLACIWVMSLIVFVSTMIEVESWPMFNKGRRYKNTSRYRRLKK